MAAHLIDKDHRDALDRVESVVVFGLVGAGLTVCAFGAIYFDIIRLFAKW
jgi:hypothetical protein